jgi:hypothetical protein
MSEVPFRDRRPNAIPRDEDYEQPLTRTSLVEANRRFRQAGVQAVIGKDVAAADRLIKKTIKERFNGRRKGFEDFPTVGDYMDYLNGLT